VELANGFNDTNRLVSRFGLGALGYDARPTYNKPTAAKLRKVSMDLLVSTPEKPAECMAEIMRG
jgi:hypothetical protein